MGANGVGVSSTFSPQYLGERDEERGDGASPGCAVIHLGDGGRIVIVLQGEGCARKKKCDCWSEHATTNKSTLRRFS